ncbi:MAG: hypothetical protein C4547_13875 [Phycisphaerales bacterium]|nr:MAG: hypothetical protein C4547_13875 [Phycisphaerales bacterium]
MLSSDEAKWIMAQAYAGETIPVTTLCGRCFYNLRGLSYDGVCPECGWRYNAAPLVMEGVFIARQTSPPIGQGLMALCCSAVAGLLLAYTVTWLSIWALTLAIVMVIAAERWATAFITGLREYRSYLRAMKRLASDDLSPD